MLSENDIREQLSIAYLHAVASRAGYAWEPTRVDRDGVDGRVCARGMIVPNASLQSPMLGFQIKATTAIQAEEGRIAYPLKQKNYNDLRGRHAEPRYLALLLLPESSDEWLQCSGDELTIRRCMYWCSLASAPENENTASTTIYLPTANVLDVRALRLLMEAAARQEPL